MRANVVMPRVEGVITDANFFGLGADAEDSHGSAAPPGVKGTVRSAAGDCDGVWRDFARIIHAEKIAFLVGERVAIVFVERAQTIFSGVNAQLQWASGFLAGVLRYGLHGKNGAGANVERYFVERGMQRDLVFA